MSHERRQLESTSEYPSGLDTNLGLFLQWPYNVAVYEGEIISARGKCFKVGVVDAIIKFGGVHCYQAPLVPSGEPSGWVTGVTLSGSDPEALSPLGTLQLTATIAPLTAINTSVAWSSSDTDVVTVDSDGLVTAVAGGTATVTVTTKDGSFTDSRVFEVSS